MFCPNCGKECGDAKFCSECGTKLLAANDEAVTAKKVDAPKSIYQANVNGQEVNMLDVFSKFGVNRNRAYAYLRHEYGISKAQAKEVFARYDEQVATGNPTYSFGVSRRTELETSGQVYCPKCLSTSISANQKGFGFGRAAIGAAFGLNVGLIVGGIGAKKVICTCLKCGYQWKPGKK